MKKVIIILCVLSIILTTGTIVFTSIKNNENQSKKKIITVIKSEIIQNEITESIDNIEKQSANSGTGKNVEGKKSIKKQDSVPNKSKKLTTDSSIMNDNSKEESISMNNNANVEIDNSNTNENSKKIEKWEKLGLTEDEYYNQPYPKGMTVDFPVSTCSNESNCYNQCSQKGLTYGDGYTFSCELVTSASGKFLGISLYVEQLQ